MHKFFISVRFRVFQKSDFAGMRGCFFLCFITHFRAKNTKKCKKMQKNAKKNTKKFAYIKNLL